MPVPMQSGGPQAQPDKLDIRQRATTAIAVPGLHYARSAKHGLRKRSAP